MNNATRFHRNERGQNALETAIILIAFIVVASVFAFAILSAGTASTERGQQAIYSGLEGVQSSMQMRGTTIAKGAGGVVTDLVFNVALVAGGNPVDLTTGAEKKVIVSYRDGTQVLNDVSWDVEWLVTKDGATADNLLEDGELAEITVDLSSASLGPNTEFTVEIKPPTGAVLLMKRTTPASIEAVSDLR
jgi:flagellin FlaB